MGGVFLQAKKFERFASVEYHPYQISSQNIIIDHILEKKVLIGFRHILSKILLRHAFLATQSKKINGIKMKKLNGTKFQPDYLPELFPVVP